jgi:hypothetical protein
MNPHVISTGVLLGHWLIVIGLTTRVIMRRSTSRSPGSPCRAIGRGSVAKIREL